MSDVSLKYILMNKSIDRDRIILSYGLGMLTMVIIMSLLLKA